MWYLLHPRSHETVECSTYLNKHTNTLNLSMYVIAFRVWNFIMWETISKTVSCTNSTLTSRYRRCRVVFVPNGQFHSSPLMKTYHYPFSMITFVQVPFFLISRISTLSLVNPNSIGWYKLNLFIPSYLTLHTNYYSELGQLRTIFIRNNAKPKSQMGMGALVP